MNNLFVQRLAVILLSICFLAGTLGATYHDCDMDKLPSRKQEMASMDCHQAMASHSKEEKRQKGCCADFSCPKCFGSALASMLLDVIEVQPVLHELTSALPGRLSFPDPSALERPPKMA